MSFEEELHAWVRAALRRQRAAQLGEDAERLLGGIPPEKLPPPQPGTPSPAEIRRASRPTEEAPTAEPVVYDWICWPSSDDAVYGWGEPYENPPGTPVNPPLGTTQASFSDTARIARELSGQDQVVHGVNKIAGLRDWRSASLLLSWDDGAIYSDGAAVKTGTDIRAACVRYTGQTPYLIWMETDSSPSRIWSQECTIVGDAVTAVVGTAEHCTITVAVDVWSEFSEDGNLLAVSYGSQTSRTALEYTVPATFAGQAASFVLLKNTPAHVVTYTSASNYDGSRQYLLKAQYRGNTAIFAELRVTIRRGLVRNILAFESFASLGYTTEAQPYRCGGCVGGDNEAALFPTPSDPNRGFQKYESTNGYTVDVELLLDSSTAFAKTLAEDSAYDIAWCSTTGGNQTWLCLGIGVDYPPATGDDPVLIGPSEVPNWPCQAVAWYDPPNNSCVPDESAVVYSEDRNNEYYEFIPQDTIDARFDRFAHIALGDSDDNGITKNKRLELAVYRQGTRQDFKSRTGEYGYVAIPDKNDTGSETDLKNNIDLMARRFCPDSGRGVTGFGRFMDVVALDVADDRTVQWLRARSEIDSLYYHINLLEGADIEDLLSISAEVNPRIVVHDSDRWMGKLR